MEEKLNFKTNTLLKDLIGKDLINDDDIAIVELVKNAYDAGSPGVIVRFDGFDNQNAILPGGDNTRIVIADGGSGMNLNDIKDKWLNIAYSEKKLAPQENGAYIAGNKGIGRFSCDRLGEQLDLLTRTKGGELLHLNIAWAEFEIEGDKDLTIQQIDLTVTDIEDTKAAKLAGLGNFPKHGTVLVITKLRNIWIRDRLIDLKRALEKFLNPNQLFLHNRFEVALSAPELIESDKGKGYLDRVNGEVQNQIFDKLQFKSTYIDATISPQDGTVKTELYHEGSLVFKLVEHNELYPLLDDVRVVIYYLNPYKKSYFKRQTGVRVVDFGSIFLFLNGFRIAPYGDRGDDWLGIDVRKTQGITRYLGSRDIVGRIEVRGSEDKFKPVSSREGMKNTDAFIELRSKLFFNVLKQLEKFVVDGLGWDSVPVNVKDHLMKDEGLNWEDVSEQYSESWDKKKQRIALSIMTLIGSSPNRIKSFWFNSALLEDVFQSREEEVKDILADIEGLSPDKVDSDLKKGLARVRSLVKQREQEAREAKKDASGLRVAVAKQAEKLKKIKGEKETYRAQTLFLQSVSSQDANDLMLFHHQINHDSIIVDKYIGKAIRELKKIPNSKGIASHLEKAAMINKKISVVAQFASKANFRSAAKKKPTDIPAFFEQYLTNVAPDFTAAGLEVVVNNMVQESFEVKASAIELSMIIDNIVGNAIKAMAKKLQVSIERKGENTLVVSFSDNGRGLSKDIQDISSMFEMGVSTTSGSGLGLFHAKGLVEGIGGKIVALPLSPKGMLIMVEVMR